MTTVLRFSRPSVSLRVLPYAGAAAVTALLLAACGGGSGGTTTGGGAPAQGSTPAPSATGGNGGGQGQRQPGVTGLIAAVNGTTMQVQTRTDQTAVSWTGATTFSKTASATLADVTVGSCVTAIDMSSAGGSGSATTPPTSITAGNVQVRPATNGECTGGFGGFGGPGGGPGGGATGAPTAPPTRTGTATPGDGRQGGFGARAVQGKVTAVSGGTITVEETLRARGQGTATATGSATAGTQQTVTVTTTGSTTFTAEKAAAAGDVKVGECATALGKADDTGAVAATSISLRPATNGSCTGGGTGGRGASSTTATKGA